MTEIEIYFKEPTQVILASPKSVGLEIQVGVEVSLESKKSVRQACRLETQDFCVTVLSRIPSSLRNLSLCL
jgi:hypothetical protein